MKKLLVTLMIALFTVTSCHEEPRVAAPSRIASDDVEYPNGCPTYGKVTEIYSFKYKSHSYLVIRFCNGTDGHIIHDPDCPCQRSTAPDTVLVLY